MVARGYNLVSMVFAMKQHSLTQLSMTIRPRRENSISTLFSLTQLEADPIAIDGAVPDPPPIAEELKVLEHPESDLDLEEGEFFRLQTRENMPLDLPLMVCCRTGS